MDDQRTDREGGGSLKAFWCGARRGIKFGALAGITIWLVIISVCLGLAVFIPDLRKPMLADLRQHSILSTVGGILAPIALMAIYGAAPGAIIMGIASLMRARRAEPPEIKK